MFPDLWEEISNTGVDFAKDESQAKKIRLANQLAISSLAIESFMMGVWGAGGYYTQAVVMLGLMATHGSTLLLTEKGQHYIARFTVVSAAAFFVFYYSLCAGRNSGTHLFFFVILVAGFALFQVDERRSLYTISGIIVLLYTLLEAFFFQQTPLIELPIWFIDLLYFSHSMLVLSFTTLFLIIISIESQATEKKLINQNNALEKTKKVLFKNQSELEKALKTRSEFLSNMSHEIRTPLNAIMGFAEVLDNDKLEKQHQHQVKLIKKASENLLHLVNDILDFSKFESANFKLEEIPFSVSKKLKEVEELISNSAKEKNLQLSFSISHSVHDFVKGDPFRFSQILLNLLTNAVKFTNSGSVSCSVELEKQQNQTQWLKIEVKDSGIGIAPSLLDKIFEDFNQAQSSITREYGGTGLGLTICKKLVTIMSGSIYVESTPTIGSTFTVIVPFEISEPIAKPELLQKTDKQAISSLDVLVVEDNDMNQLVMAQLLKAFDIKPDFASSGKEALLLMEKKTYNLILLDLQMPKMSGFEVFHHMKKLKLQPEDIKVIAITADVFEETKEKALMMGIDKVVNKPINKNTLYDTITSCL